MNRKNILVVGNQIDKLDNNALKLVKKVAKQLKHLNFLSWDPTEELPPETPADLVIIDVVLGLVELRVFEDLKVFSQSPRNTVHDYDLPIALGLLLKIKKIKSIKIIGVPPNKIDQTMQIGLIKILQAI